MTARNWVGLAVRIIGFWVVVRAAINLLESVPYLHGSEEGLSLGTVMFSYWSKSIAMLLFGGWMVFKADGIVHLICRAQIGRQSK